MASVAFEQVDKVFGGGVYALRGLTLAIANGELLVCVGPSGCGKSTLLRLLAGLEEVTRGELRIDGRIVNHLPPQRRNVAMVFQDYALYPYLSVRGNLEFPLKMRKLPRPEIRRRVEQVAAMLGMTELLERLPKQLSGGQRQRVAMGRALVRDPTVFLLDEPLSNLDARLRVQVRAEIGDLQQRTGTTMIYVTHDQVEAMTLGDRVAVLNRGVLQQVAPPQTLYEHPDNVFVAGFIGNPPMNLFPARLVDGAQGRLALQWREQQMPLHSAPVGWHAWLERPLTAGIRPEAVQVADPTAEGILTTVVDSEYLGHETLVKVRPMPAGADSATTIIVARLPGMRHFSPGDGLRIQFATDRLYLFADDGKALILSEASHESCL
jgi:multiple sugar transport system ATP-binding protein